jgi:hypothetical protein
MAQVYRVMVQCPHTKNVLDTGIRTSGRESLNGNAYRDGTVTCHHCGQLHSIEETGFLKLDTNGAGDDIWRPNP